MITLKQVTGNCDSHIHWLDKQTGIHKDALNAWEALKKAANHAGFNLVIASGFRDFDRQLSIWNRKYLQELPVFNLQNNTVDFTTLSNVEKVYAILLYSALPGASRHHWGTDIDIYAANLLPENTSLQLTPWEYQKDGYFFELSIWLKEHAKQFGFVFPYDKYRHGVAQEPWHLSYQPIASQYQKKLSVADLKTTILSADISAKNEIVENISDIYQKFIINLGDMNLE